MVLPSLKRVLPIIRLAVAAEHRLLLPANPRPGAAAVSTVRTRQALSSSNLAPSAALLLWRQLTWLLLWLQPALPLLPRWWRWQLEGGEHLCMAGAVLGEQLASRNRYTTQRLKLGSGQPKAGFNEAVLPGRSC